jgi:hypothetical protein|tara:strand:- start:385 stop:624 length:240 start_codon:yes stop_codon:yes gene_type:complete
MGEREERPTVNESDEEKKTPLPRLRLNADEYLVHVTATEELKDATEINALVNKIMQKRHANLEFEHLLVWWLSCEPIEA